MTTAGDEKEKIAEVVLASEEVQLRNVEMVVQYTKDTRKIVRELDERIIALRNIVMTQQGTIEQYQKQLALVQQRIYAGGTDGDNS